nr:M48 family metallopeptidase [Altererythrobacter sp. KTW20L]
MILHSADQYGAPLPGAFAQGPVEVAQIVPGSSAASAGLRAGDALLAVDGTVIDEVEAAPGFPRRDAVFELVASNSGPIDLRYLRAGSILTATLQAPSGCRALVEVLADEDSTARSDGRVIQLSYGLVARLNDAGLAVVFAHELAHVVLEHRRRLSEAGVADGLARQFGRNRRLSRLAEIEADLLSVHLLANAGYDPAIAPQFWQSDAGRVLGSGLVRSRIYPGRNERAEQMEQEIAQYLSGYDQLSAAGHLIALRDQPFAD